jgi:hypothetical protein
MTDDPIMSRLKRLKKIDDPDESLIEYLLILRKTKGYVEVDRHMTIDPIEMKFSTLWISVLPYGNDPGFLVNLVSNMRTG